MSQVVMFGFAVLMLFYWFRHNCASILRTNMSREAAARIAEANLLRFPEVEARAREATPEELDAMDAWLRRDFQVLTCLLRYTSGLHAVRYTLEQRLLIVDFHLLRLWFALTRRWLHAQARRSLSERSRILVHFANTMGERSAAASRV